MLGLTLYSLWVWLARSITNHTTMSPVCLTHTDTRIKRMVFLFCHLTPEYTDSGHLKTGSLDTWCGQDECHKILEKRAQNILAEKQSEVIRNVRQVNHTCWIMCCGRDLIHIWTAPNMCWCWVQTLWYFYTRGNRLETVRQDVVGCHGKDGGSCWDTGERTAGPSDVNVGIRQRCVRIHTMLRWK